MKLTIGRKSRDFLLQYKAGIVTGLIFLFFFFTMFFQLNHSALWGDEWHEYYDSQEAIGNGDLYQKIVGTFQPPLYNLLIHFWLKINCSVEWFRFFNVIIGMAAGVFLFFTIKRLYHTKIAACSLCALAVTFQWIYCIQECSEYALMLFFLAGAFWFYVDSEYRFQYWKMLLFLLMCIGAIYSQYGSVFVAIPLLGFYYFGRMLRKSSVREKIIVNFTYLAGFTMFAIPLYHFFLKLQLQNNEISEHTVTLGLSLFKEILTVPGNLIGYFYNLQSSDAWVFFWGVISVFLLGGLIYLFIKGNLPWVKKSLLLIFFCAYFLHYLLVELHIYAMVHPDESSGFYCRYSYFYIPLICLVLPIFFCELYKCLKPERLKKGLIMAGGMGILCSFLSFYAVLQNWNKALDDQFAAIWMSERGWEDITYLIGNANVGFNYYVPREEGFQESYLEYVYHASEIDVENLPESFWLWRTNWSGGAYQSTIDAAVERGYTVKVYNDSGYFGQLAYVYKW